MQFGSLFQVGLVCSVLVGGRVYTDCTKTARGKVWLVTGGTLTGTAAAFALAMVTDVQPESKFWLLVRAALMFAVAVGLGLFAPVLTPHALARRTAHARARARAPHARACTTVFA